MSFKVNLENTLSAVEAVVENPGAVTGPKASDYKYNTINVPMPKTNVQLALEAGASAAFETDSLTEAAFFHNMIGKIAGLNVTVEGFEVAEPEAAEASVVDEGTPAAYDPATDAGEGEGEDDGQADPDAE